MTLKAAAAPRLQSSFLRTVPAHARRCRASLGVVTRPVHIGPDPSEVCTLPEYDSTSIRPCSGEAHAHADLDQAAPPSCLCSILVPSRAQSSPTIADPLCISSLHRKTLAFSLPPSLPSLLSPSHSRFQLMQVDRSFHLGAPGSVMIDISRMPSFSTSPRGPAAFAQSLPFFNIRRRQLTRPHLPIFPQSPQSPLWAPFWLLLYSSSSSFQLPLPVSLGALSLHRTR